MCISVQRPVHRPLVVRVLDGMHGDRPRAEPRVAREHLGELVPRPLHDARRAPVDDGRARDVLHAGLAVDQRDLVEVGTQADGRVLGLVDAVLFYGPVARQFPDSFDTILRDQGYKSVPGKALEATMHISYCRLLRRLSVLVVLLHQILPSLSFEQLILATSMYPIHLSLIHI